MWAFVGWVNRVNATLRQQDIDALARWRVVKLAGIALEIEHGPKRR